MKDPIELELEIIRETRLAVRFSDGDREEWIPKSLIEYEGKVGETVVVMMPEWVAFDNGFI